MSMTKGTPASSQILWLENLVARQEDEIERLRGEIVVLKESLNKANAKNSQILQRLHDAKMKGYVDG